jgi:hypothetical protein
MSAIEQVQPVTSQDPYRQPHRWAQINGLGSQCKDGKRPRNYASLKSKSTFCILCKGSSSQSRFIFSAELMLIASAYLLATQPH